MGVLNNINYLKEVQYFPCADPDPLILITTALEAGAPTLLEFYSWGCRDILKLRAGYSNFCGRKYRAIVAKWHPPGFIDKLHKSYGFFVPIDKLLYGWLIADLTSGFLAKWTSLAYAAQGCIPDPTTQQWTGSPQIPQGILANHETGIVYRISQIGTGGGFVSPTAASVPAGWYISITFSVKVEPLFAGQGVNVNTWLQPIAGSGAHIAEQSFSPPYFGGGTRARGKAYFQTPDTGFAHGYEWRIHVDKTCFIVAGDLQVIISPLPILNYGLQPLSCLGKDVTQYLEGLLPDVPLIP